MPRQASIGRWLQSVSALPLSAACCLATLLAFPAGGGAQTQPACAARDWRCLLNAAAADVQKDSQDNGDSHGRYLVDIAQSYPETEQVGIAQHFLAAAGTDEDLQTRIESFLVPARLACPPDVEVLRKALASGTSPEPDFALSEYARMAFEGLIARNDRGAILKLWREEGRHLWRDAPQAELAIDSWLAETAPDLLKESIRTRGLADGGWASLSAVAERLCRAGAKDKGDGLLALLETERTEWNTNRSHDTVNLASSVTAVAACDGFEAAEKRLDLSFEQMKSDIAAIKTHIADKEDAQANIELLQQAVAETGVHPLVRAYLDAGRVDDAIRCFERLPPPEPSTDVALGTDGSPGEPGASTGEGGWHDEYSSWAQGRSFSGNPALVLADVDRWEKEDDDNVGVDAMAQMQRTTDALPGFQGAKRPYVVRLKALGERIAALPGADGLPREQTQVMLAASELRLAGCLPGEAQLVNWQKAFAGATDLQTRVEGRVSLAKLLRLMENTAAADKRDPGYGECVIATKG